MDFSNFQTQAERNESDWMRVYGLDFTIAPDSSPLQGF